MEKLFSEKQQEWISGFFAGANTRLLEQTEQQPAQI